jgi:hypothetical protein
MLAGMAPANSRARVLPAVVRPWRASDAGREGGVGPYVRIRESAWDARAGPARRAQASATAGRGGHGPAGGGGRPRRRGFAFIRLFSASPSAFPPSTSDSMTGRKRARPGGWRGGEEPSLPGKYGAQSGRGTATAAQQASLNWCGWNAGAGRQRCMGVVIGVVARPPTFASRMPGWMPARPSRATRRRRGRADPRPNRCQRQLRTAQTAEVALPTPPESSCGPGHSPLGPRRRAVASHSAIRLPPSTSESTTRGERAHPGGWRSGGRAAAPRGRAGRRRHSPAHVCLADAGMDAGPPVAGDAAARGGGGRAEPMPDHDVESRGGRQPNPCCGVGYGLLGHGRRRPRRPLQRMCGRAHGHVLLRPHFPGSAGLRPPPTRGRASFRPLCAPSLAGAGAERSAGAGSRGGRAGRSPRRLPRSGADPSASPRTSLRPVPFCGRGWEGTA